MKKNKNKKILLSCFIVFFLISSCVYKGDNKVFAQEEESDSGIICTRNDPLSPSRNILEIPIGRATDQAEHLADNIISKIDIIIENAELQARRAQQLIELVEQCGTGCQPKCDHNEITIGWEENGNCGYDPNSPCHSDCPNCCPPNNDCKEDCRSLCSYNTCSSEHDDCGNAYYCGIEENCGSPYDCCLGTEYTVCSPNEPDVDAVCDDPYYDNCVAGDTYPCEGSILSVCPNCTAGHTYACADSGTNCYNHSGATIISSEYTLDNCQNLGNDIDIPEDEDSWWAIFQYDEGAGWCNVENTDTCEESQTCDTCWDCQDYEDCQDTCRDTCYGVCDAGDCYCASGTENTTCPCPYTSMDIVICCTGAFCACSDNSISGLASIISNTYQEILAYYNDFGVDDVPANSEWTTAGYISFYSDYYNDLELKVMPKLEVSRQRLAECVTDPQAMEEISAGRLGINKLFSCSDLVEQIGFSTTLIYSYLPDADGEPKNYIEEGCYGNSYCHAKYIEGEEDDLPYPAPCAEDYYCCSM